jgi:Flp pilus assembly protein TadB
VVDLFMDETRRKREASCSRTLPELPSKTEKDEDKRLAQLDRERQAIEEREEREERQKKMRERKRRDKDNNDCVKFSIFYSMVFTFFWLAMVTLFSKGWVVRVCWTAGYVALIALITLVTAADVNRPEDSEQRQERLLEDQTGTGY